MVAIGVLGRNIIPTIWDRETSFKLFTKDFIIVL